MYRFKKSSNSKKKLILSNSIFNLEIQIPNEDTFDQSMENLGYRLIARSFLVKKINEIDINITRRNGIIETITGYQNNSLIDIPDDILSEVKNDINNSL